MTKPKLIYLHGLASSGASRTATMLREELTGFDVLSLDIPVDPQEACEFLDQLAETEKPDIVIGTSMGAMWSLRFHQCIRLLVNPAFHVSQILRTEIGVNPFLNPRQDGATTFEVTQELCDAYEEMEQKLFTLVQPGDRTYGFFAVNDELVDGTSEFREHFLIPAPINKENMRSIPGGHRLEPSVLERIIIPFIEDIIKIVDDTQASEGEKRSDFVRYKLGYMRLFHQLQNLFQMRKVGSIGYEELRDRKNDMLHRFRFLPCVRNVYKQEVNGDSELLYLLMISLFVEEGKTQFGMEDFDFLYEREKLKSFDMKHLERGDHPLFRQGLIQYCVYNGITDRQHYRLTQKTAELFDF